MLKRYRGRFTNLQPQGSSASGRSCCPATYQSSSYGTLSRTWRTNGYNAVLYDPERPDETPLKPYDWVYVLNRDGVPDRTCEFIWTVNVRRVASCQSLAGAVGSESCLRVTSRS